MIRRVAIALLGLGVVAGCGGSSSGGGGGPPPEQAPRGNFTQVEVNGDTVDVTETTLYGYTCLVGTPDVWYHDYSPVIWCDPIKGAQP